MKKINHGEKPVNEDHGKIDILDRDSLISLHCKQRDNVTIEESRVLCPFVKNYNKPHVRVDETKFPWLKDNKSVRFLVRVVRGRETLTKRLSSKRMDTLALIVFSGFVP